MRMFCIMSSLLLPCCPVRFPHNWLPADNPMSWFTVKMTSLTKNKKSGFLRKLICPDLSRSHSPMGKWVRDGGASSNVSKSSLTWPSSFLWLLPWCPGSHLTHVLILNPDGVGRELERGVIGRPGRITEVRSLLRTQSHVVLESIIPDLKLSSKNIQPHKKYWEKKSAYRGSRRRSPRRRAWPGLRPSRHTRRECSKYPCQCRRRYTRR